MISTILSRVVILLFGTLYPAYASYKAIRTKNVKEYVKWMMYWIVFALFSCIETFTDIFLSWFPFYYEVKVIIVLWLLSPATKGSSTLYRKFVHPMLTKREQEIDEYISQAKEKGYSAVLQLGSKGVNYATNVIMQTAIKTMERIPTSRSENSLTYSIDNNERSNQNYGTDSTDDGNMIIRSVSYDTALSSNYYNNDPLQMDHDYGIDQNNVIDDEEEEQQQLQQQQQQQQVVINDNGAARSRGITKRNTRSARATTSTLTKLPVKGRRRIHRVKEEPLEQETILVD